MGDQSKLPCADYSAAMRVVLLAALRFFLKNGARTEIALSMYFAPS
jgi:hypothetical protein